MSKAPESSSESSSAKSRSATPNKPKRKPHPGGPATKAQHAALKRVDKMVIKRMRKR